MPKKAHIQSMAEAIADVCGLNLAIPKHERSAFAAANSIYPHDPAASAEAIRGEFATYWRTVVYKGTLGELPQPNELVMHWAKRKTTKPPGNGHANAPPEPSPTRRSVWPDEPPDKVTPEQKAQIRLEERRRASQPTR